MLNNIDNPAAAQLRPGRSGGSVAPAPGLHTSFPFCAAEGGLVQYLQALSITGFAPDADLIQAAATAQAYVGLIQAAIADAGGGDRGDLSHASAGHVESDPQEHQVGHAVQEQAQGGEPAAHRQ